MTQTYADDNAPLSTAWSLANSYPGSHGYFWDVSTPSVASTAGNGDFVVAWSEHGYLAYPTYQSEINGVTGHSDGTWSSEFTIRSESTSTSGLFYRTPALAHLPKTEHPTGQLIGKHCPSRGPRRSSMTWPGRAQRLSHAVRLQAILVVLVLLASCSRPAPHPRVFLVGIDGLEPEVLDLMIDEGSLPSFARIRKHGAWGALVSPEPRLSPILWTTIASGQTPDRHGISGFVAVDRQTGEPVPVSSELRRVPALWNLVSEHDRSVATVGWWATWPAEPVNGWIISDRSCYHFLFDQPFADQPPPQESESGEGLTYPPELWSSIRSRIRRPGDVGLEQVLRFADVSREMLEQPFSFNEDVGHLRWILATTQTYRTLSLELLDTYRPDLLMVYFEGVDSASHLFGHLFRTQGLKGPLAEQQQRYGETVEQMYRLADEVLGEILDRADEQTTVIIASDHGFQLGALHDSPGLDLDIRRVSEDFHRPLGHLSMLGHGVKAGARIHEAEQIDLAPTVLALLGLPIPSDLPGRVLDGAVSLPHPPTFEPPRETSSSGNGAAPPARSTSDQQMLRHLEALGYIDRNEASEKVGQVEDVPESRQMRAGVLIEQGRYREARLQIEQLLQNEPESPILHTNLAICLVNLGQMDQALEQLDAAQKVAPLMPEIYHNRGAIFERQGHGTEAAEQYRTALRYAPHFKPARESLLRLTGTTMPNPPRSAAEAQAYELAESAHQAAVRGDLEAASQWLDEAERIAPDLATIHHYRSNVAYLRGDLETATEAMTTALKLEPSNELFRHNLDRLRLELARPARQRTPQSPR